MFNGSGNSPVLMPHSRVELLVANTRLVSIRPSTLSVPVYGSKLPYPDDKAKENRASHAA